MLGEPTNEQHAVYLLCVRQGRGEGPGVGVLLLELRWRWRDRHDVSEDPLEKGQLDESCVTDALALPATVGDTQDRILT